MELVVKVSEKDYLNFMLQYDNGVLDETVPSHRAKIAIANGTLLPNGHGRLIDAAELRMDTEWDEHIGCFTAYSHSEIVNAETVVEADEEGADNDD